MPLLTIRAVKNEMARRPALSNFFKSRKRLRIARMIALVIWGVTVCPPFPWFSYSVVIVCCRVSVSRRRTKSLQITDGKRPIH